MRDRLLAFHLADSQTFRAFCRFAAFGKTPCASTLQENIAKLTPATLELLNQCLIRIGKKEGLETGKKVRVDTTSVEANVHAPSDSSLLWDCTRSVVRLLRRAKPYGVAFRDRSRAVKTRAYRIAYMRGKDRRKPVYEEMLKHVRLLMRDAKRALSRLRSSENAVALITRLQHYIELTERVISQTKRRVLNGESVPAADKVISVFEPHVDIIRKGSNTTFGHEICLTVGTSLILDVVVERGNPADVELTQKVLKRFADQCGAPKQAVFDGGFCSRENLIELKAMGIEDVVFTKARHISLDEMAKSAWVYRQLRRFRASALRIPTSALQS